MSDLQSIHVELAHRGVRVYGLNVPRFDENAETLAAFKEQAGLTYPVLSHGGTLYLVDFAGSDGFPYPRDMIVDQRRGRIVYTNRHYDAQTARDVIMNLLEAPP